MQFKFVVSTFEIICNGVGKIFFEKSLGRIPKSQYIIRYHLHTEHHSILGCKRYCITVFHNMFYVFRILFLWANNVGIGNTIFKLSKCLFHIWSR